LLTLILGFIATIFYVFIYTPMKRKSTFSLFMGAIPGAIPPLMGWTSVTNSISGLGIVLFGILFIWQLPHFLAIALYYNPQYVSARIKTVPNTVGVWATKWRVAFYTIALAAVTFSPYVLGHQNVAYVYLTAIVTALFVILSMQGLFIKEEKSNLLWARRYFLGSIIYLPTVLFILIFFKS
jgi:protoheme IX farnesyltransferase